MMDKAKSGFNSLKIDLPSIIISRSKTNSYVVLISILEYYDMLG